MFKLIKKRHIIWPVVIQTPVDGGGIREYTANVKFEDLPQDEQEKIYRDGGVDADLMRRVVIGWNPGEFKGEDDQDIAFSAEALNELLLVNYVAAAFVKAYIELHNGRAAARKN